MHDGKGHTARKTRRVMPAWSASVLAPRFAQIPPWRSGVSSPVCPRPSPPGGEFVRFCRSFGFGKSRLSCQRGF